MKIIDKLKEFGFTIETNPDGSINFYLEPDEKGNYDKYLLNKLKGGESK